MASPVAVGLSEAEETSAGLQQAVGFQDKMTRDPTFNLPGSIVRFGDNQLEVSIPWNDTDLVLNSAEQVPMIRGTALFMGLNVSFVRLFDY